MAVVFSLLVVVIARLLSVLISYNSACHPKFVNLIKNA